MQINWSIPLYKNINKFVKPKGEKCHLRFAKKQKNKQTKTNKNKQKQTRIM